MRIKYRLAFQAAIALCIASAASGEKGLGPLYNQQYSNLGEIEAYTAQSGTVTVTIDEIQTINCAGCDTRFLAPGRLMHLTNNTREPICAAVAFTPDASDWRLHKWGSMTAYYIGKGKTLRKVAGLFYINSGNDSGAPDLRFTYKLHYWQPNRDKTCPPGDFG